jgi:Flp pilus assembly pilin Flp
MTYARTIGSRLVRDERGTEVIEYALLLGMLVCACMTLISALGTKVVQRWTKVNEMF